MVLSADQNSILRVPPALLHGCVQLSTLTLHQNPISFEVRHPAMETALPTDTLFCKLSHASTNILDIRRHKCGRLLHIDA